LDPNSNESQYDKLILEITKQLAVTEAELAEQARLAAEKARLAAEERARKEAELPKSTLEYVGGLKRSRSKFPSYKYYLKAFKSYSKRKLKTFRKRRNYKKTKRGKH